MAIARASAALRETTRCIRLSRYNYIDWLLLGDSGVSGTTTVQTTSYVCWQADYDLATVST